MKKAIRIQCRTCGAKIRVRIPDGISRFRVKCPKCHTQIRYTISRKLQPIHPDKDAVKQVNGGPMIFLAIADRSLSQRFVVPVMNELKAQVRLYETGDEVLNAIHETPPHILIVESALPGVMGFQIIDHIRNHDDDRHIRTILLASLTRPTRYHRPPTHYYGADAYIEPNTPVPHFLRTVRELLRKKQTQDVPSSEAEVTTLPSARRLARLLVTDFILYHLDKIKEALERGTLYLDFAEEIEHMTTYFKKRVSSEILEIENPLQELLDELQRSRELQTFFNNGEQE